MNTKLGSAFRLRSTYSSRRSLSAARRSYRNSLKTGSTDVSSLTNSGSKSYGVRASRYSRLRSASSIKEAISGGESLLESILKTKDENYKTEAAENFSIINKTQQEMNARIPSMLKKAGVPEDVTFEFDYDIDAQKAVVTKISDEKYRAGVENVINDKLGNGMYYTAYASRVMNGYASSAYYTEIASSLKSCYGQDISDLYIDKGGSIGGANSSLQRAIRSAKSGRTYVASRNFPAKDIEGVLKRLLSDKKNITPNVSHMGYDGKSLYTNDGKFKLGKIVDSSVFNNKSYAARGSIALASQRDYDGWLKIDEKYL